MKSVTEAFTAYAADYDRWVDAPEGKALFETEVEAVRLLTEGMKKPFLEVGVGTGRFARAFGIEFGIDPSLGMLEPP